MLNERYRGSESLPYRATVFLRCVDVRENDSGRRDTNASEPGLPVPPESVDLMERCFAKEDDAVIWCNVMSEAEPQATGVWFVALSRGGRLMTITREDGLRVKHDRSARVDGHEFDAVLAAAGMASSAELACKPVRLEAVGSA